MVVMHSSKIASSGAISGVISSSSCCQRSAVRQCAGLPSRWCWILAAISSSKICEVAI
jgi:hypothetical protein